MNFWAQVLSLSNTQLHTHRGVHMCSERAGGSLKTEVPFPSVIVSEVSASTAESWLTGNKADSEMEGQGADTESQRENQDPPWSVGLRAGPVMSHHLRGPLLPKLSCQRCMQTGANRDLTPKRVCHLCSCNPKPSVTHYRASESSKASDFSGLLWTAEPLFSFPFQEAQL